MKLLLSFLLLFQNIALAEEVTTTSLPVPPATPVIQGLLDMKTAIARGLAFSPDVQKAKSVVNQADAGFRLAESSLFPNIKAQGLTRTSRNSVTYDPNNATGNAQLQSLYSEAYTAQLVAQQPLYMGGKLEAGLEDGRVQQDLAKQKYFKAKQDYLQSLLNAYYDASSNAQKLSMAQLNRDILKGYYEVTVKYVNIGRSKGIDRLQAEANLLLSEAEILRLEAAEETSVQALLKLTGDTNLAHAKLESHFDAQPVNLGSLDEAYEHATDSNPDLRIAKLNISDQRYQNEIVNASDWPTLTLDGTFGYQSPDRQNVFDNSGEFYVVGLTLTVPLFTGLSSISQHRVNRELLTQKEKDAKNEELTVKQNLAVALATVQRNFAQLKLNRDAAESTRKAMDVALRDYRQGLLTSTDVITLQNTRYNAETAFLTAQFSYLQQVLNLRHDLGTDLEKIYAK
jgi:outer membrane protein